MARSFGASAPKVYDPLKVVTQRMPRALAKHGPVLGTAFAVNKLDEHELGKKVAEKTGYQPSTLLVAAGLVGSFLPWGNYWADLSLDLAIGAGFAKVMRL